MCFNFHARGWCNNGQGYVMHEPKASALKHLWLAKCVISNSYITSTRDVSGLNCDARGHVQYQSEKMHRITVHYKTQQKQQVHYT